MMNFNDIPTRMRDAYAARFEPEGQRSLAYLYWRSLLVLTGVLLVLAVAWGLWNLFDVFTLLASEPDTSPLPKAALDRSALMNVVQGFEARQVQWNELTGSPASSISDPSK
jgi:hypothetical protein